MSWRINIMSALLLAVGAWPCQAEQRYVDITVDISEQEMYVQTPAGNALWKVSTGKLGHDTPTGEYGVSRMEVDHYSRKYDNAPMPHSVFFHEGYAIHGTTHVAKLGQPASKGCVRLHPDSAKNLFEIIEFFGTNNTIIRIVP